MLCISSRPQCVNHNWSPLAHLEVGILVDISASEARHLRDGSDVDVGVGEQEDVHTTACCYTFLAELCVEIMLRSEDRLKQRHAGKYIWHVSDCGFKMSHFSQGAMSSPKNTVDTMLHIDSTIVFCQACKMGTFSTLKSRMSPIILFVGAHVPTNLGLLMAI